MDVFKMLLLTAKENQLILTATDLEVSLRTIIPAEVTGGGEVAINPKSFSDSLKLANHEDVFLNLSDNFTLNCDCGDFKTTHFGTSSESYPLVAIGDDTDFIQLDARGLSDAIDKTIYSTSSTDKTYNLNGVFFSREEEEDQPKLLRMTSTDTQRMNVATLEAENLDIFQPSGGIIVPKKGLQELRAICEPLVVINVALVDNSLVAQTDDSLLKIRLLSGHFPDYRAVIPTGLELQAWLNRKFFLETVRRVCFLMDTKHVISDLTFSRDNLTIEFTNPELGTAEDSLAVDYSGPEYKSRFNPNFFLESLSAMKSDRISLEFSEVTSSFLLTGPEDPGYYGVIVSVR
jgi:DNA polymerase-3 subunit beta